MYQAENNAGHSLESPPEDVVPSIGVSRADTLPEISDEHAAALHKLQVSDGDFRTEAKVNDDGRVEIHINQNSHHLASHIVPTLRNHMKGTVEPPPPSVESLPETFIGKSDGLPPPIMNIVIHVVGSRGDVQPFVSLGKVLREKYGHRIRLATHPTFKTFVEENGLEFFSIGGDPAELMAFMVKNPGLMPGLDSLKSGDVGQRRRGMFQIVKGCWRSCIETGDGMSDDDPDYSKGLPESLRPFVADAIIANPPSFAHVHCAERLGIPLHLMFTMPWSPTQSFPHPLTTVHSSNAEPNMTNLVSYALVEMMTWQGLGDVMNRFRTRTLGLEPVSLMWAPGMTSRLRIPFTYCWSPALIPKPEDWGNHIYISGFYFLSLASSYTPDPKLVAFLDAGPPPVYIGFGSIVVEDPNAMTTLIFEAVKKAGVRALVSKGWGGFGGDELEIPENIFMLGNIPHDYLFKHVSAVVHHGGAGTTAAGILAGRPTVVVPFFGDQPFWGAMTARAGAGPDPVPFKHLTSDSLAAALLKALTPEALEKAKQLGESIAKEEGAEAGAESFHRMLDINKHRCLVSPTRVARVRIRKSKIRLSALAVIVLGDEGLIQPSDLKIYRPCEYDSEDGPWDPLTGGASALLGTLSSLMVGIADLPVAAIQGLKTSVQKSAAERAAKASSPPATPPKTPSASDLSLNEPTVSDSTASSRTDLSSTSTLTGTSDPDDNVKIEAQEVEPLLLTPEKRAHTIQLSAVPHSKHTHHIDPGDACSHKAAVRAEKGATITAAMTLRPAMDFTLAIARGFHNAPKLYGDDTVRAPDKIIDFKTGVAAAGKEFGYGWYDGISGLVTQPFNGAKMDGIKGFLQGIGKGVGGFVLKPGAAIWGLGGYTFKGIYRELQKHMGSNTQSYIIASRITQGHLDYDDSTLEERQMIIENYKKIKDDPAMYKIPSHLSQSSTNLKNKLHRHHSETDLSQTETNRRTHSHHSIKHVLHLHQHNSSEADLSKTETSESQKSTHSHRSIRHALHLDHKHNRSSPELDRQLTADGETSSFIDEGGKHKHSLRGHFHLHKHGDGTILQSASEADLTKEQKDIPVVHEAEVRSVIV